MEPGWLDRLGAHWWTVAPRLLPAPLGGADGDAEPWRGELAEEDRRVALAGVWQEVPGAPAAVVVLHGLGGCHESPYVRHATAALRAAGLSSLRLSLRGADLSGEDLYHAGLTADVGAAFAHPALAAYSRVLLLGFSLGGHVALRYACESPDPRLAGVAAVCSPLDLAAAQAAFDEPAGWLYRRYVLRRLVRHYAAVARRGALAEEARPLEAVASVRTIRDWDRLTVVPRFGFRDVDDYYGRASVGPLLGGLEVPSLLVATPADPMVSRRSVEAAAAGASPNLEVRWAAGGHVGFPPGLDLGESAGSGLARQVAAWLRRRAAVGAIK